MEFVKGLIIKSPHIEKILNGEKTWEIRGHNTKLRGEIALIKSGSGKIIGTCEITGSKGPLSLKELNGNKRLTGLTKNMERLPYKNTYAWVVKNPRWLKQPIEYRHPNGAVIWVNISSTIF